MVIRMKNYLDMFTLVLLPTTVFDPYKRVTRVFDSMLYGVNFIIFVAYTDDIFIPVLSNTKIVFDLYKWVTRVFDSMFYNFCCVLNICFFFVKVRMCSVLPFFLRFFCVLFVHLIDLRLLVSSTFSNTDLVFVTWLYWLPLL